MPYICPVCSKKYYPQSQNCIQCDTCQGWVHHENRLKCSGLTDFEYAQHQIEEYKPFECDNCISRIISKENNSVFLRLPFPVECEDNIFGKPEVKPRADVSSLSPDQLKKFIKQCDLIQEQLQETRDVNEELVSSVVDSKYYDIKQHPQFMASPLAT